LFPCPLVSQIHLTKTHAHNFEFIKGWIRVCGSPFPLKNTWIINQINVSLWFQWVACYINSCNQQQIKLTTKCWSSFPIQFIPPPPFISVKYCCLFETSDENTTKPLFWHIAGYRVAIIKVKSLCSTARSRDTSFL
jgi:hypothetical protein